MVLNQRILFERILCPIALSPESDEALRYAIALAQAYGSKLYVCHSEERRAGGRSHSNHTKKVLDASIEKRLRPPRSSRLGWESFIMEGDAAAAITAEAAQRRIDLIVMRSRRRPHAAALLGSTAESVCRTAPCPVFVTHPDEQDWVGMSTNQISLESVLVAYDYSGDSELALAYGLSLAQEYQAQLHVLHVLPQRVKPEAPEVALLPLSAEGAFAEAIARLRAAVPVDAREWCVVKEIVREGQVYREVLSYAEERNIDLICLGASGTGFGMRALFGSNADRVLRQTPCPILIARPLRPSVAAFPAANDATTSMSKQRRLI